MRAGLLLALRMLKRDWSAGELRVLGASIVVAVSCVTAVVFFTDRISQALTHQAGELIAADLRLVADHPVPDRYEQLMQRQSLRSARTISFRSMVLHGTKTQLAELKAVSGTYPLRGQVRISRTLYGAGEAASGVPAAGKIWVEAALLRQLGMGVGDTVQLGAHPFVVDAVIVYEPDRSGDMFSIAPRVMLNVVDLGNTELLQEGSRAHYSLLVAGEPKAIAAYRNAIEPKLGRGERLETVQDARQEVRIALQRAQQFLGLAAIVSVILACVAVALSARRFAERHLNACAILRCLGARQVQITQIYFFQLLILSLVASALGCGFGYAAQSVLADLLGQLLLVRLPMPSAWPVLTGFVIGMVGLLGFALPPVMRLKRVSTLRVFRRELGSIPPLSLSSYLLGIIALLLLVLWQSGDLKLGGIVLAGLLVTTLVLIALAYVLVLALTRVPLGEGVAWRFGIKNIVRKPAASVVQVLAFGVGIMVMLLLTLVRGDILQAWQNKLPQDAANRFVINIQKHQTEAVLEFFQQQGLSKVSLFPMVRGRLQTINGIQIDTGKYEEQRAKNLLNREFNLSWARRMQEDNKIVAGAWWPDNGQWRNEISLEQGIAKTLGIELGDELSFMISGSLFKAKVTSIRTVQWDSFRPNFFVILPPVLAEYPVSYITSFHLTQDRTEILEQLVKRFPNLTVVDISAVMDQVRNIMDKVNLAVEYVFMFTLLAGLMVLYAAIQTTQDQRVRENAILRALGAKRRRLLQGLVAEFAVVGALAGILAAALALVLAYVVSVQVLELAYAFNPWIPLLGLLGGALGVGVGGTLGARKVLAKPPLVVLRDAL
ncbi:MAG: FtsX-like permease family protein [Gammaproteobacteria bacterium]|nr:FtsX-like permease family protein [Gammaproteobacteria bacterium]MDH5800737.1 FtsX-like permease family protein [Gammaproteobacteria bacterium]